MKAIVVQLPVRSALAHDQMDKVANFSLFMLMKEYTTIINCVGGRTITSWNHLDSLLDANESTTLNSK